MPALASVTAVIPAAGSGTRMGIGTPKQYLELNGKPILEWTLEAIGRSPDIAAIVLVVPPADLETATARYAGFPKISKVVAGGEKRADSVFNGVRAAETEWVLAHDAARPFASPSLIARTIEAARRHGAATAALPASDTLKTRNGELLGGSIDRETVLLIQTPQVFRARDLIDAREKMKTSAMEWTDETSLLRESGITVGWVAGETSNIKITTPDDLRLARLLAGC